MESDSYFDARAEFLSQVIAARHAQRSPLTDSVVKGMKTIIADDEAEGVFPHVLGEVDRVLDAFAMSCIAQNRSVQSNEALDEAKLLFIEAGTELRAALDEEAIFTVEEFVARLATTKEIQLAYLKAIKDQTILRSATSSQSPFDAEAAELLYNHLNQHNALFSRSESPMREGSSCSSSSSSSMSGIGRENSNLVLIASDAWFNDECVRTECTEMIADAIRESDETEYEERLMLEIMQDYRVVNALTQTRFRGAAWMFKEFSVECRSKRRSLHDAEALRLAQGSYFQREDHRQVLLDVGVTTAEEFIDRAFKQQCDLYLALKHIRDHIGISHFMAAVMLYICAGKRVEISAFINGELHPYCKPPRRTTDDDGIVLLQGPMPKMLVAMLNQGKKAVDAATLSTNLAQHKAATFHRIPSTSPKRMGSIENACAMYQEHPSDKSLREVIRTYNNAARKGPHGTKGESEFAHKVRVKSGRDVLQQLHESGKPLPPAEVIRDIVAIMCDPNAGTMMPKSHNEVDTMCEWIIDHCEKIKKHIETETVKNIVEEKFFSDVKELTEVQLNQRAALGARGARNATELSNLAVQHISGEYHYLANAQPSEATRLLLDNVQKKMAVVGIFFAHHDRPFLSFNEVQWSLTGGELASPAPRPSHERDVHDGPVRQQSDAENTCSA